MEFQSFSDVFRDILSEKSIVQETIIELDSSSSVDSSVVDIENISQLLRNAADSRAGLTFLLDDTNTTQLSYAKLLERATIKSKLLHKIPGISDDSVVLLHFGSHLENIEWFWAATLAGYIPAISTPFVNDLTQRRKHLVHLETLLNQPIVLTTEKRVPEFLDAGLSLHTVESLSVNSVVNDIPTRHPEVHDIALLMLTSGSTGNAKAVPLRHGQILDALKGKSTHHGTTSSDNFLNWIGMDHVASLTEVHLHAMSLSANQVHLPAIKLLQNPLKFIELLNEHKIAYTFAPNFFLTKLRDSLKESTTPITADLSHLKALISGGEANVVATCAALTEQLYQFGIQGEVIRPGFGMTETCAGSIYSRACPSYDISKDLEFANLGICVPGIKMRIMTASGTKARAGEKGDLQVSGPIVFTEYFNNAVATEEAFTTDGWFITGDLAYIDNAGNLNLAGRSKDTIIVNGVKYTSQEIETAIEEEGISGLVPSFTVAFPHRPTGSATEQICILYRASYDAENGRARFETASAIAKTVALITTRTPDHLIPVPEKLLEKSSLGKISRSKMRIAFEKGDFSAFENNNGEALSAYRLSKWQSASTPTEETVRDTLSSLLDIQREDINMQASVFDLGLTSFTLIRLKRTLESAFPTISIPMSTLLLKPTVSAISATIDSLISKPLTYNPIVPLQPTGSKTPLFCIHPGSGDILVFIALASQFTNRPVYALKTRGYNAGESLFESLPQLVDNYTKHIRSVQSEGPYAIAGYSLGCIIAFEVAKKLEAAGQEVRFLATIDNPPHIQKYVHDIDWFDVMVHIAYFLEVISEGTMVKVTPLLHTMDRPSALKHILKIGDQERILALALDEDRLNLIADIGERFRINVEDYTPAGLVASMDVFVADPPCYAGKDRAVWRDNELSRWGEFSRTPLVYHECAGVHAKMMNREYIADVAKRMKTAMKQRGV